MMRCSLPEKDHAECVILFCVQKRGDHVGELCADAVGDIFFNFRLRFIHIKHVHLIVTFYII